MGSYCCNNLHDKQNETSFEDLNPNSKRISGLSPIDDKKLFTVVEVFGDDTGQSYLRQSCEKFRSLSDAYNKN